MTPEDIAILRACLTRCVPRADIGVVRKLELRGYLLGGSAVYVGNRSFETTRMGREALDLGKTLP